MFTAYYILAVAFGLSCVAIAFYGIKARPDGDAFPGKLSGPIMAVAALLAVATLAAVIHGGSQEVKQRKQEAKQKATAAAPSAAPAPRANRG